MSSIPDARTSELDGVPRVLARAVHVLRCFTYVDDTLSLRQLVERARLPRSTVHRLLVDMVSLGLVVRTGNGRFAIGTLVWELGQFSPIHVRLRQAAQDHLTRLYEACGENVFIAVLTTSSPMTAEVMYVGQVRGPRSVPVDAHEGGRFPLHATSAGKALLAGQLPDWVNRYMRRELNGLDPASALLRKEIAAAQARGYATHVEGIAPRSSGIATSIPADSDMPPAVVAIVSSVERWDERRYWAMLKMTAQSIAKDLRRDR